MRWRQGRRSTNIEDRRRTGLGRGGFKIGGIGILLLVIFAFFTGQNPLQLIGSLVEEQPNQTEPAQNHDQQKDFVSVVLGDTEDTWSKLFSQMNRVYEPPGLVLFSDVVQSACGMASAASGPFYCPPDHRVYLDLTFFHELDQRFEAPGDFAQAYVIAHEVGHHVQNLLGISEQVHKMQQGALKKEANELSIRLELQADCLAGVWGYYASRQRQMLEPGDLEEGLSAAAAVGDDRIQRDSTGTVSPETWTHGSSDMRVRWFQRGFNSGQSGRCNTFESGL